MLCTTPTRWLNFNAMLSAFVLAVAVLSPRETAEQLFTTAEQEEHELDLAAALEHYEASIAADPSNRWALRASARARWLRARSDGGFGPLVRLEHVRRDPGAQRDASAVDALARDLEDFPPGEVRVEARMFVAEAYATLGRPSEAERELVKLVEEPEGDPPIRAQAATRLADLAMARGDVATAKRAASRVAAFDPQLVSRVLRWARRRIMERGATLVVGLFVVMGGATAVRRLRVKSRAELVRFLPRAALVCAYLGLVAALLASSYEQGNALPFLLVPACLWPITLIARAWALAGTSSRAGRMARGAFSAVAVVAVAFLVLDRIDIRYLESFGL